MPRPERCRPWIVAIQKSFYKPPSEKPPNPKAEGLCHTVCVRPGRYGASPHHVDEAYQFIRA